MDERNWKFIDKIIFYAEKIFRYCENVDEDSFINDIKLVEACVFNLIQIGESARNLDKQFVEAHDDIAWNQIRGLRNRIVHEIFVYLS